MSDFSVGEATWIAKLGNLRNVIRQEVIARQIASHIGERHTALDVGCGQGTQAIRLLQTGCAVVGIDPSNELIGRFRTDAAALGLEPEIHRGSLQDLDELLGEACFDVVCSHGLMMYLDDVPHSMRALATRVAPGGLLSVTFKSGHGLAMRPALRKDWTGALAAFNDDRYMNELGVRATAHRLEQIEGWIADLNLEMIEWYGVRVFNDAVAGDVLPPSDGSLPALLDAEELAGRTDPYRWLGSQLHVLAHRPPGRI